MKYYVTYTGSAIIEAENEDEACEKALDKIDITISVCEMAIYIGKELSYEVRRR